MKKFVILLIFGISLLVSGYVLKTSFKTDSNIDTNVSDILVMDYYFEFDKDKKVYEVAIKKETSKLDIKIDTKAKYEISGNNNLKDGSIVYINILKSGRTVDTYQLNITENYKLDFFNYNIEECDSCNEKDGIKKVMVDNKYIDLKFSYDHLNEKNCPNTYLISIVGTIFFSQEMPCTSFYDFNVIGKIILFSYKNTDGNFVMAINTDGYALLKLDKIGDVKLSSYSDNDAIKISGNSFSVVTSNVVGNEVLVNDDYVFLCDLDDSYVIGNEYRYDLVGERFSNGVLANTISKGDIEKKYNCK